MEKLNRRLKELNDQEAELTSVEEMDYEAIAKVKGNLINVKERLKELEPQVKDIRVTMDDVARVIELWTGIPAEKVSEDVGKRMAHLERNSRLGSSDRIRRSMRLSPRSAVRKFV